MITLLWCVGIYVLIGLILFVIAIVSDFDHLIMHLYLWWAIILMYPYFIIKAYLDYIHEHKGFK